MKNANSRLLLGLGLLLLCFTISSCKEDESVSTNQRTFGIFKVLDGDAIAEMNGTINSNTPGNFDQLVAKYPNVKRINMLECPGSEDDEANLIVSKKMHELEIEFHLFSSSFIASGAVDMYVAGTKRTRDAGSRIGVHSWSDGPGQPIATSYPVGHTKHLFYINYYTSVGFTQKQAEDFYYFTINAAPAADVHWMTEAEIETHGLVTN